MTREELKAHCEKQIKGCEMWAKHKGEEPSGRIYEEHKLILELLEQQPCEDMVSLGVFEQVMWERDVAIEQLKELGYGLGEKIRTDGDTISRQKTIEAFEKWICSDYKDDYPIMSFIGIQTILEEQPFVKPQELCDKCVYSTK